MNRDELFSWIDYHSSLNPDWTRRIGKVDRTRSDAWQRLFYGCSLEAAKQATDEMLAGQLQRPFEAEAHITAIASRARALSVSNTFDDDRFQTAVTCRLCHDQLFVSVVHPRMFALVESGAFTAWLEWHNAGQVGRQPGTKVFASAATWCRCRRAQAVAECEASERKAGRTSSAVMPTFDPKRFVQWTGNKAEMIEAVMNWKPANYQPAFDDWNGSSSEQEGFEWQEQ